MRCVGMLLAACLGLSVPTVAPAQEARNDSPQTAQVKKLIEQLASPSFAQRQKARLELEKIGAAALPELKAAMKSPDQEVGRLAEVLCARLEEQRQTAKLLAPKLVHLSVNEVPVADAVKELNRLSGYTIQIQGDPAAAERRRVTIDTGKAVPFWEAFDLLCDKCNLVIAGATTGNGPGVYPASTAPATKVGKGGKMGMGGAAALKQQQIAAAQLAQIQAAQWKGSKKYYPNQPAYVSNGPITVQPGDASAARQLVCLSGAVRIQAIAPTVTKDHVQLTLRVSPEPGVENFGLIGTPLVEKAVDEHGELLSMIPQNVPGYSNYNPYNGITYYQQPMNFASLTQQQLQVTLGAKTPRRLKEICGRLSAQVLLPTEPMIVIKDVMKGDKKSATGKEGGTMTLHSIRKINNRHYEVQVEIANAPGINNGNVQVIGGGGVFIQGNVVINGKFGNNNPQSNSVVLVDGKGKSLRFQYVSSNQSIWAAGRISQRMTMHFESDNDQTEPERLMLVGRQMATVSIPFHFENVPLN